MIGLGNKGISVSIIIVIVVAVAAAAFVMGSNYKVPAPPVAARAPLAEGSEASDQQTAEAETAGAETPEQETANESSTTSETAPVVEEVKSLGNHVVISEVKFSGNEFVELYNPTDSEISLEGWWVGYYPPFSNWNEPKIFIPLKLGSKIKSHGFFLIGGKGYTSGADSQLAPSADQVILGEYGAVAIFSQDIRGIPNADDIKTKKADSVGWGVSDYIAETSPIIMDDYTSQSKSLERKPGSTEPTGGNYVDTNANADDFLVSESAEPQYSTSAVEP